MRSPKRILALVPTLLWACGASAPEPAHPRVDGCEPPHPAEGHSLEIFLAVARNGQTQPLCPGAQLSQDEELWVTVELDTASHVRMVYVAPNGETGELTRQDDADLTRNAIFRAPEGLLSRAPGEAQLVIIASREPLEESDPVMGSMLDVIRDTGNLVERDGSVRPPPPGAAPPREPVRIDRGGQGLHADFNERGVAMLTVPLISAP